MRPYIQVTGVVGECSKADATFEVTVEQYIACYKSTNTKEPGSRLKPATTFFGHIPDSPRYKSWSNKPVPGSKRFVSFCGFLSGVDMFGDGSEVEKFRIDNVDNITFCGQYVQPAPVASMNSQTCTCVELFYHLVTDV